MASLISNTAVASAGKVINSVLGLAVTIALTRLLGVEHYGSFIVLLSYGMLFQGLADFGLYLTLSKELGRSEVAHQAGKVSHILSLRLILFILAFTASLGIGWFIPSIRITIGWLVIIMAGLLAQAVSQLCMAVYQARRFMWPATLGDSLGRVAQLLFIIIVQVAITAGTFSVAGLTMASVSFVVSTAVALLVHWWWLPVRVDIARKNDWHSTKKILSSSWPLALLLILNMVYFRIDMVMLSAMRGAKEVGLYALAYRIIENLLFFPAMFGGLLLPQFSQLLKEKKRALSIKLLEQAFLVGLLGAGFIVASLTAVAGPIITLLSGVLFLPAAPLLAILSLAMGIMAIGNIVGFALVAGEKQKQLLALYGFLVVFNISLNWLFIPHFGALAAAWITVATECIACGTALGLVYKIIPFRLNGADMMLTVASAGITYLLLIYSQSFLPVVLALPLSLVCYGLCCYLFGLVSKKRFSQLLIA